MADPNTFAPIDLGHFPHVAESRTPTFATAAYNATVRQPESARTRSVRIESLRAIHRSCLHIVAASELASRGTAELDTWASRATRELRLALSAMDAPTGLPGELVPTLTPPSDDLCAMMAELRYLVGAKAGSVQHAIDHLLDVNSTVASLAALWNGSFAGQPMPPPPNFGQIRECFVVSLDIVSSARQYWTRQIRATICEALTLIDLVCERMMREHSAAVEQRRDEGC